MTSWLRRTERSWTCTDLSRLRRTLQKSPRDRKSTRLNSSHLVISYAVFCLKKKKKITSLPVNQIAKPPEQDRPLLDRMDWRTSHPLPLSIAFTVHPARTPTRSHLLHRTSD